MDTDRENLMFKKAGEDSRHKMVSLRLLSSDPDLVRSISLPEVPGNKRLYLRTVYFNKLRTKGHFWI
ncbi:MAG: hypothetical protein K1000chlam4_00096 [Chlamydiae bacterium]|nr:hypothetical protein [Chlamydiota bacterium]